MGMNDTTFLNIVLVDSAWLSITGDAVMTLMRRSRKPKVSRAKAVDTLRDFGLISPGHPLVPLRSPLKIRL